MSTFPGSPRWPLPMQGQAQLPQQAASVMQDGERVNALMAALNPPQAEAVPQIAEQGEWGLPAPGITQTQNPEDEPLFGELPGEGYLYPHAPDVRRQALVETDPEFVRMTLLRVIEVAGNAAQLPFSENKPSEWGHLILSCAQAYLLLDPSVDNEGVPVDKEEIHEEGHAGEESSTQPSKPSSPSSEGAKQTSSGGGSGQPKAVTTGGEKGHQTFKRTVTKHGHVLAPRVQENPAEKAIRKKHEEQEQELRADRGDRPRPQPRVGQ